MNAIKAFKAGFTAARRQKDFDRAFRHLMTMEADDPHAVASTARQMSKVFFKYGSPETWTDHKWLGVEDFEATLIAYSSWSRGLWSFVEGVARPPKKAEPVLVLPMSEMVQ